MNERFVAVSTVTGSKIRGCFSKPRRDFSVTRGWQQMMHAIRWIKQWRAYTDVFCFLQLCWLCLTSRWHWLFCVSVEDHAVLLSYETLA